MRRWPGCARCKSSPEMEGICRITPEPALSHWSWRAHEHPLSTGVYILSDSNTGCNVAYCRVGSLNFPSSAPTCHPAHAAAVSHKVPIWLFWQPRFVRQAPLLPLSQAGWGFPPHSTLYSLGLLYRTAQKCSKPAPP